MFQPSFWCRISQLPSTVARCWSLPRWWSHVFKKTDPILLLSWRLSMESPLVAMVWTLEFSSLQIRFVQTLCWRLPQWKPAEIAAGPTDRSPKKPAEKTCLRRRWSWAPHQQWHPGSRGSHENDVLTVYYDITYCGWLRNPAPPKGWLKHVETL